MGGSAQNLRNWVKGERTQKPCELPTNLGVISKGILDIAHERKHSIYLRGKRSNICETS